MSHDVMRFVVFVICIADRFSLGNSGRIRLDAQQLNSVGPAKFSKVLSHKNATRQYAGFSDPSGCVENAQSRRSTDVILYWRDETTKRLYFAAKPWNLDAYHRVGDSAGIVMGSPTGTFYRKCLKPSDLSNGMTCEKAFLPNIDPTTRACEGKSLGPAPLEKGEADGLTFAMSQPKIKIHNNALTPSHVGCSSLDWVSCLGEKGSISQRLDVELTPDNSGIAKPMHVFAYLVEVYEPVKSALNIPVKGKEDLGITWLSCEETQSKFEDEEGNTKWRYIHAKVVSQSSYCGKEADTNAATDALQDGLNKKDQKNASAKTLIAPFLYLWLSFFRWHLRADPIS